jgi:hypothetical protein
LTCSGFDANLHLQGRLQVRRLEECPVFRGVNDMWRWLRRWWLSWQKPKMTDVLRQFNKRMQVQTRRGTHTKFMDTLTPSEASAFLRRLTVGWWGRIRKQRTKTIIGGQC